MLLRDEGVRARAHARDQRVALGGVEIAAEHRVEVLVRERRLDDQILEIRDHRLERRPLAAPPGRDRGQDQAPAEKPLGDGGQKAEPGRRLEHTAPERVADEHVTEAHRREQPRHAERRIGAQLHRVAEIIIQPAQDGVHALQSGERLQINARVTDGEVVALHQGKPELAGDIGVLEVGLVERARREYHRNGLVAGIPQELRAQRREERTEWAHVHDLREMRKRTAHDLPVLQRIARTRRPLRTVGEHPPAPVGGAREVDRIEREPAILGRTHAHARPEKVRMSERDLRRQRALRKQLLRTIQIREHRVQERRTLRDACLDVLPLLRRHEIRQRIEDPGAVAALRVRVHVIGDAVLDDHAPRELGGAARGARIVLEYAVDQRAPVIAHASVAVQQLVVATRIAAVALESRIAHRLGGSRRSKVKGNSSLDSAGAGCTAPGVWPMRKKRARRRLSASNAFTGKVSWLRPPGCTT